MPQSFLGADYVAGTRVDSDITVYSHKTLGKRQDSVQLPNHAFTFEIHLSPDSLGAERLAAKVAAHKQTHGFSTPFTIACPIFDNDGEQPTSKRFRVQTKQDARANSITVRQTAGSVPTRILIGQWLRGSTQTGVYRVREDVTINTLNSDVTVPIFPNLQEDINAMTTIVMNDVEATVLYNAERGNFHWVRESNLEGIDTPVLDLIESRP